LLEFYPVCYDPLQYGAVANKYITIFLYSVAVLIHDIFFRHLLEFYPAYYEPLRNGAVFVWDLLAKTVHHSSLAAADGYYWVMERAPLVADKVSRING